MVSTHLGTIYRYTCAAPIYLQRRSVPGTVEALATHDLIEMPGLDGRPRPWSFSRPGEATITVENEPRIAVNDPVTIHRLVANGAGIGMLSGYICAPDIAAGKLVHLFPEWRSSPLDVSLVFPSSRELSPSVRAFVTYMKAVSAVGLSWQDDILAVSRATTASVEVVPRSRPRAQAVLDAKGGMNLSANQAGDRGGPCDALLGEPAHGAT